MALSELEKDGFGYLSSLEKIKLGRECYIPDCLLSGYLDFVTRYKPITDEEAIAMGPLTAVRLCRIRETFLFDNDRKVAEKRARDSNNIKLGEFCKEFVNLQERAERHLQSSGPARSLTLKIAAVDSMSRCMCCLGINA